MVVDLWARPCVSSSQCALTSIPKCSLARRAGSQYGSVLKLPRFLPFSEGRAPQVKIKPNLLHGSLQRFSLLLNCKLRSTL